MFPCAGVILKGGVSVSQCRVSGVAGFRGKTEVGDVQSAEPCRSSLCLACGIVCAMAGVKRQCQDYAYECCSAE